MTALVCLFMNYCFPNQNLEFMIDKVANFDTIKTPVFPTDIRNFLTLWDTRWEELLMTEDADFSQDGNVMEQFLI